MSRRERGATVGVMWVIVLIVLLLAAGGWIYSRESEFARLENNLRQAQAESQTAIAELEKRNETIGTLSKAVGFRAADNADSNLELIQTRMTELRSAHPNDIGAAVDTLQAAVDRLKTMYDAQVERAKQAHEQFTSENQLRIAAETAKAEIEQQLNQQIAQLNNDLRDERDRAQSQKSQDDARITALDSQLNEASASRRTLESEFATERSTMQRERDRVEGRVVELAGKIKLIGADEAPNDPDGAVVAVSQQTGMVYVDVGAQDLVRRGLKFDVYRRAKGGYLEPKGTIEVREVNADSAVCGIVEQMRSTDPIAPGDVIANPLFSTNRQKVFALVGNFPVYGKNFLEKRLRDQGAEVESGITPRVDFVILGEKAPDEDAVEVNDLPEFKEAERLNIQMLRLQDVERFLRL